MPMIFAWNRGLGPLAKRPIYSIGRIDSAIGTAKL